MDIISKRHRDRADWTMYQEANVDIRKIQSLSLGSTPYARVYYNEDYLKTKLQSLFDVKAVIPSAFGYQTAYLLEKR